MVKVSLDSGSVFLQQKKSKPEIDESAEKATKSPWHDGRMSPTAHESLMELPLKLLFKDVFKKGFTPRRFKKKVKGIKKLWYSPSFARLKDILTERPMREGVPRDSSMDLLRLPGHEGSDYADSDDEDTLQTETRDVKDRRTVEVKAKDLVEEMKTEYESILEEDLIVLQERCNAWVNHLVDLGRIQFLQHEDDEVKRQFKSVINDMRNSIKRFKKRTRIELFTHYQRSRRKALTQIVDFFADDISLRTELTKKLVESELNFKLARVKEDIDKEYQNIFRQQVRLWDLKLQRLVERQEKANRAHIQNAKKHLEAELMLKKSQRSERIEESIREFKKSVRYSNVGISRQLDAQEKVIADLERATEVQLSSCDLATRFFNFVKHFDSWHIRSEHEEKTVKLEEETSGEDKRAEIVEEKSGSLIVTATWKEVVDELLAMYQRLVDYALEGNQRTVDFLLSEQALYKLRDKLIAKKEADLEEKIKCEMRLKEIGVDKKSKEQELRGETSEVKSLSPQGIITSIIDSIIKRATAIESGWSLQSAGEDDMAQFIANAVSSYQFLDISEGE